MYYSRYLHENLVPWAKTQQKNAIADSLSTSHTGINDKIRRDTIDKL